jgi:hypothetical protein
LNRNQKPPGVNTSAAKTCLRTFPNLAQRPTR